MKISQKRAISSENTRGFAAILIVFVLGMVGLLIAVSSVKTGFLASIMGRAFPESAKAFYYANAGIEDAVYRLNEFYGNPDDFEDPINFDYPFTFPNGDTEGSAQINVEEQPDGIIKVESVGYYGKYIRRITAEFKNTLVSGDSFIYAIHAGLGGLEMENNTLVSSLPNGDGNVYSNSYIKGEKDNDCSNSESTTKIIGTAWAHTDITRLGELGSEDNAGVCIEKDAFAENLLHCYILGGSQSPNPQGEYCSSESEPTVGGDAPEEKDLPNMRISDLKNYIETSGEQFDGDCILDGSGGPDDCSYGTYTIGNIKINGNLIIDPDSPHTKVQISGPVWVAEIPGIPQAIRESGNLEIAAGVTMGPIEANKEIGQMIVVDRKIETGAGDIFVSNPHPTDPNIAAFLIFISTLPSSMEICEDSPEENYTISLKSNSDSVLFYATEGCVLVDANGSFQGAILGKKVRINNNSEILYDPRLQYALFSLSGNEGWQITSFKED